MSDGPFNRFLWHIQEYMGWWFWLPLILYGVLIVVTTVRLLPAGSRLGRIIRMVLAAAALCLCFIWWANGLGGFALHLLAIAVILINHQTYLACKAAGKLGGKLTGQTVMGRVAERLTERENGAD